MGGFAPSPTSISCFLRGKVSKGVFSLGRRQGPFKPTALSATLVSASGSVQAEAVTGESTFGQKQVFHLLPTTWHSL